MSIAVLPTRGVVEVSGEDRVGFLQGLVSGDVTLAAPGRLIWSALLTPQGRYLADFFIHDLGDRLLLECPVAQAAALATRLSRYRLRAPVTVADRSGTWRVMAAWGERPDGAWPGGALSNGAWSADPRLSMAGWRAVVPADASGPAADSTAEAYDRHRLSLGLPDGPPDLEPDKTLLLEAGFDELGGVSWTKGCYMGQELTARTRYRGLVKRRLVPVIADEGTLPPPGTDLFIDGTERGTMRSGRDGYGLAMIRTEGLADGAGLIGGDKRLRVSLPTWLVLGQGRIV